MSVQDPFGNRLTFTKVISAKQLIATGGDEFGV